MPAKRSTNSFPRPLQSQILARTHFMKSKRTRPAPAAPRGRRVPNPFPPVTRRLAKRLLEFAELPEPDRTRAYDTWLNSAGSPKRNATRQGRVRELYDLIDAIGKKLTPSERESIRSLGKSILAKASRALPGGPEPRSARPRASRDGFRQGIRR